MKPVVLAVFMLGFLCFHGGDALAAGKVNDFPTEARAEYVFACMAANNMDFLYLRKCSCAVDAIASRMTYEEYVHAETILRLQRSYSPDADVYRSVRVYKKPLDALFRAQAAAELKCF